ncbi:MAG TPA: hypothetical protein VHB25_21885 [Gemmatimonadaceae bacterium]|nr:hypothetical protein [Gemmatimonadaceae bacterium]
MLDRFARSASRRFPATRAMGRLGVIAAVLSGLAVALHLGGRDGYALPLSYLLGAPGNLGTLRLLAAIHPIPPHALSSGADWNAYLLVFTGSIALNWTCIGLAADLFDRRPPRRRETLKPPVELPELTNGDVDPLVREFEELERKVRERPRPRGRGTYRRAA